MRLTPEEVVAAYQRLMMGCVVPITFWGGRDKKIVDASVIGIVYLRKFPLENPSTRDALFWFDNKYGSEYRRGLREGFVSGGMEAEATDRWKEGYEDGVAIRRAVEEAGIPITGERT